MAYSVKKFFLSTFGNVSLVRSPVAPALGLDLAAFKPDENAISFNSNAFEFDENAFSNVENAFVNVENASEFN